jgi:hypothetical protein
MQCTNLSNLKDKKEELLKYDPGREHDKYEIEKSTQQRFELRKKTQSEYWPRGFF